MKWKRRNQPYNLAVSFLLQQIFENTNHQQENHVVRRQQKRSLHFYNKVRFSYSKPDADFQFQLLQGTLLQFSRKLTTSKVKAFNYNKTFYCFVFEKERKNRTTSSRLPIEHIFGFIILCIERIFVVFLFFCYFVCYLNNGFNVLFPQSIYKECFLFYNEAEMLWIF